MNQWYGPKFFDVLSKFGDACLFWLQKRTLDKIYHTCVRLFCLSVKPFSELSIQKNYDNSKEIEN